MTIFLKFKEWILGAVGAILAVMTIYIAGRQQGKKAEADSRDRADRKESRRIEDEADHARLRTGDPTDRLRKHKRLRD